MRGIEKITFINALKKADANIFTEDDIQDLFYEIGKECSYNEDGEVEFELTNFYDKFKKENQEESEEVNNDSPMSQSLDQQIINYGPYIICYNCSNKCTNKSNCALYNYAQEVYNKYINR